jgi:flagellar biosynthesis GTPase FlhF
MESSEKFTELEPTISIWFLQKNTLKNQHHHSRFSVMERQCGEILSDHLDLHVIELEKWDRPEHFQNMDSWIEFLKEGENVDPDNPPPEFQFPEARKAMQTLVHFSDDDVAHDLYRRQVEFRAIMNTVQGDVEDLTLALEEKSREAEWNRREAEQSKRDAEEKARQAEQSKREAEQSKRDAEQSKRDAEQSKRDAEQSKRDAEEKARQAERNKQDAERLRQKLINAGLDPEA